LTKGVAYLFYQLFEERHFTPVRFPAGKDGVVLEQRFRPDFISGAGYSLLPKSRVGQG
jgi:hypothetical protein